MAKTYIISAEKLTEDGFIHGNVETKVLSVIIERVQLTKIKPVLGGVLYRKILEFIQDEQENSTPIPAAYLTLIDDYIVPALIPLIEIRATTHLNWKMKNKAVGTSSDEYIRPSVRQETSDLKDELMADAMAARNELIRFLKANSSDYPEYLERNSVDIYPEDQESAGDDSIMFVVGGLPRKRNEDECCDL